MKLEKLGAPDAPVFVIAEAGVNHNGELGLAKKLVDVSVAAGADAVKFQTFSAERVASSTAPKAQYQRETTAQHESQLSMLRRLELSANEHRQLQAYCRRQDILFMSTPFDRASADLLDELGVPLFKIGSGEVTNKPFLQHVARKSKPILLSTGMCYLSEVDEAVRLIQTESNQRLVLLHCVSSYPADPADANLRAMRTLATAFHVPVGYSDHTPGVEVALAAVALGACVIEKHITLDKNLEGPDHRASLDPEELKMLIAGIRTVETALGHGVKRPAPGEEENRTVARRSLHAIADIPKGTRLRLDMLDALRPAGGISPTLIDAVIGRTLKRPLRAGEPLFWSDVE